MVTIYFNYHILTCNLFQIFIFVFQLYEITNDKHEILYALYVLNADILKS